MGGMGILLLVGTALASLMELNGLDAPHFGDEDQQRGNVNAEQNENAPANHLLLGTDTADVRTGGQGRDWIIGLDGEDTIAGGTGDDLIIATGVTGPAALLATDEEADFTPDDVELINLTA